MEYLNGVVSHQDIDRDWNILGRNLNPDGVRQTGTLQFCDFCRHGCGKQICRPFLGYNFQNLIENGAKVQIQ